MTIPVKSPLLRAVDGVVLSQVVPSLLRQQVVEILRNAITECVFEPGGKLIERELCEMLGVSRTTLREGLRQLEAEGLLELTPNRGPMVASLDMESAAGAYAMRAQLEGFASAECAARATASDVAALRRCLGEMTRAYEGGDFKALQSTKTIFYDSLYDIAANAELKRTLRLLRARVTLIRGLDVNRESRMQETLDGAKSILAAIARRDSAAARHAAEEHISRAATLAINAMRAETTTGSVAPGRTVPQVGARGSRRQQRAR